MLDKKLSPPGSPYDYDRTLAVFHLDRSLSEFPTLGFLSDVEWSPGNKFVAVSNRRANSGDYLWVFSLADGKPVKVPEDQDDAKGVSAVGDVEARVLRKFPEYSGRKIDRYFIAPDGWRSATELKVEIRVRFFRSPVVTIHDVYRVTAARIVRFQEKFVQSAR